MLSFLAILEQFKKLAPQTSIGISNILPKSKNLQPLGLLKCFQHLVAVWFVQ